MTTLETVSIERLFRIDGDVAVITGAGAGIGRIAALTLAGAGAVVAVTDIDGEAARRVADEITSGGGRAEPFTLDVADRPALKSTIARIAERFGGIQILVNNAGIGRRGPTEDLPDEDWDEVVEVNMTAPFICAREAGRHMLAAGNGRIISISSIMGLVGNDLFPHLPYMATKGALVNMTRALAVEWAGRGVRVNAIAPSFFKTDFGQAMWRDPDRVRLVEQRTPIGRFGEPEELAGGILFLASPASSMVTGHTLAIDGGWLAK
jgi:NAD(P)-dependent dehydrogenase (short-subunit alcohol dehydrogenase family)